MRFKKGKHDHGYNYHGRLFVQCSNPEHQAVGCGKSRSTKLLAETFGRQAPLLFLGAWLQGSWMPVEEHRGYSPSVPAMQAYGDSM